MVSLLIITVALSIPALLRTLESVYINSVRQRTDHSLKPDNPGLELIRLVRNYPARVIYSIHAGILICLAVFTATITSSMVPRLAVMADSGTAAVVIMLLLSPVAFIIFVSIVSGLLLASHDLFIKYLSLPAFFFLLVFFPAGRLITALTMFFCKIFWGKKAEKVHLNELILSRIGNDYSGASDETEPGRQKNRIFRNVLDFSHLMLREIMVPRTEIEAVPVSGSADYLREKFISTRFSRILVYKETIDNIAGYVEVKDIFRNPADITSSLRKLAIVPETMPASRLLKMFVSDRKNIALVVDEFGGTSGMVTIEDLLEEIVGDIEDEHDKSDLVEKSINQNEFIFSGRLEIDYLNEKYHLNLPESDDYATLAGLVLFHHGSIPAINEIIRIGNNSVKILRSSSTRIELVNLRKRIA